ncbi:YcnI family protein [Luteipulveratus mongoliensis]|uniref:YncI copper-binding domain-containing protein n=1 Tax=Luteipulveratus mongoliensis TaxID=571913 RepID=A0A0K1JPB4_9MICO|nr:YcnI family protein [Luteipulveratus mongoliensis]AKU18415.1 hypothetical protein VV02_25465 [Luteipulveratus mongoliensis]
MRSNLPTTRVLAVTTLAGITLALGTAAAQAHVRVTPSTTEAGAYSQLTFRVPNERDDANTTKVAITLPQTDPFLSVSVKPVPGWTVATTTAKLPKPVVDEGTTITEAVRTVTWTADAASAIKPEQFQEFSMNVGKLPKAGAHVVLPADQTYSSGEVVHWSEVEKGGKEPEHPAPDLEVTAPAAAPAAPVAQAAPKADETDSTARWIGGGGLAAGLVGIGVGVLGWRRPRQDGSV